jgi:hypothetical protein
MREADGAEIQEIVFGILERAASKGIRCPTNSEAVAELNALSHRPRSATSMPKIIQSLVRSGMITVRVYGCNFRQVIILEGPCAGRATLRPSHDGQPYIILDKVERLRRDDAPKW